MPLKGLTDGTHPFGKPGPETNEKLPAAMSSQELPGALGVQRSFSRPGAASQGLLDTGSRRGLLETST